ncbi:MAG: hypothetical protein IPN29_14695 [Saprospiraceae bacterium]|nr:hypothetical protein [Saprospiraceae bacterium]
MSKSAKTLFYFGIYVLLTGLSILLVPQTFVTTLGLPDIPTGWARVIGLLVVVIGSYDLVIAKENATVLIRFSVFTRLFFALGVFFLVASQQMNTATLPLGVIDAVTAAWTWFTLRSETKA